tara:strand:+ start:1649 stop:2458 length:810 start_codon:yes stop_codon:yes gene_type:complete
MIDNKIIDIIKKDKFLITRPGVVEMESIAINKPTTLLETNAGYYNTNNSQNSYKEWEFQYVDSMKNSNLVLIVKDWFDNGYLNKTLIPQFKNLHIDYYDKIHPYPKDITTYLKSLEILTKNKKVLIIFPFTDSLNDNIVVLDKINPDFKINAVNILTYKTPQTIKGNNYPHNNWLETYEKIKTDISKIDFDVAFLSCGCYGHPLSNFIHQTLDKSAFYVGARLQLCFGINGRRWDNETTTKKRVNKYWSRPKNNEKPTNFNKVEGGCYW